MLNILYYKLCVLTKWDNIEIHVILIYHKHNLGFCSERKVCSKCKHGELIFNIPLIFVYNTHTFLPWTAGLVSLVSALNLFAGWSWYRRSRFMALECKDAKLEASPGVLLSTEAVIVQKDSITNWLNVHRTRSYANSLLWCLSGYSLSILQILPLLL